MRVKLKVFSIMRKIVGAGSLSMEMPKGSTVRDLLSSLDEKYGSAFHKETGKKLFDRIISNFNIFLNSEALIFPNQLSVVLKDGDKITILQPSGGG